MWFLLKFSGKKATLAQPQKKCDLNQANLIVGKNAVKQMEDTLLLSILCGVRANRMADNWTGNELNWTSEDDFQE